MVADLGQMNICDVYVIFSNLNPSIRITKSLCINNFATIQYITKKTGTSYIKQNVSQSCFHN